MEEKDNKMKKVKVSLWNGSSVINIAENKVTKTTGEDKTECSLLRRSQVSYCEECKDEFEGDCPVHGPYNYIQDKEVMKGDPLRADHTLPDCLEIKTSKIVTAGVGVFTKEGLESRIMFGPYCGDIITGKQAVLKTRYCWQIYTESKPSHFVDAQNKAVSNWMRYVNCATTEADQNLVAFQYKGGIYYCTFKPVLPGEELLVWYGDECARELGLIRDKNLLFRPKYVNGKETSIINACGGQSHVLNIGQQIHVNVRNYNTYNVCSCAIKGSTKLKIQDFFTRFEKTFDGPYTLSKSVLWLSGLALDKSNNSNIVHSDYDYLNVSNIIIIFDNIFHRLWLSVNVTGNATQISCKTSWLADSTSIAPPTRETDEEESTLAHYTTTVINTETLTNATFENNSSTFDAAGDGSSLILFSTAGGSFAFVSVLAITGIVVYRRRRRKETDKSPMAPETYPIRLDSIDSLGFQNVSMQDAVDSNNACQTVANIPRITRGSAEYALSMPPGTYSYALTYHKSSASETTKSMSEQTGSSKTDVILADAEEGICNPYFILLPLNEQEIGATKDDYCTDYSVCGADDDRSVAPINAEQSMHVYNHIMLGRGATEGENENDIRCADDYSHISIDSVNAIGNGRYYNIVNINAGRSEPVDDYCHIGPNNAYFHAHVTLDDYNHIVL